MATDSIKELITQNLVDTVGAVASVKVVRRTKADLDEIEEFAVTQLPAVAIEEEGFSSEYHWRPGVPRDGKQKADRKETEVQFVLTLYVLDNQTPEETLNDIMDDIIRAVDEDPSRGGLAYRTECREGERGAVPPIRAQNIKAAVSYRHKTDSM